MLIKELTQLSGASGNEHAVREYIKEYVQKNISGVEISTDVMGNLICRKKGNGKRIAIAAHMDEVGLIITEITADGFLKFDTVGGIETAVLGGKRVFVGENRIPGITSAKAVHLQTKSELLTPLKIKDIAIDIGAFSKEEAEKVVKVGDYAVFDGKFAELENGFVKSKALDDRVGCAILLELLKEDYESDVYFVFTVQEEVGLRGARCAAYNICPDLALVIEGTTCADTLNEDCSAHVTTPGGGAVMTAIDGAAVSDKELFNLIKKLAEKNNIPLQIKRTDRGGTDAGAIAYSGGGTKTAVLAVPCRYIHSPIGVMHTDDAKSVYHLAKALLKNIEGSEFRWN